MKAGDVPMAVKSTKPRKRGKRLCLICGRSIPMSRLKVLPDTETCVKCATVERYSRLDVPTSAFAQHPEASQSDEDEDYT
jgi:RNA polymerase-binding transcription factor DksA